MGPEMAAYGGSICSEQAARPEQVVLFQSWCMTGLGATAGVAGEAVPDGGAGHWMISGAGGR